jgi:hypothetical protein
MENFESGSGRSGFEFCSLCVLIFKYSHTVYVTIKQVTYCRHCCYCCPEAGCLERGNKPSDSTKDW